MSDGAISAVAPPPKPSMLSLLKDGNLRALWLAQSVSWTGDNFTFLALMIVINQLTGSAGGVALLMLVMTVPRLVFGMVAGVFIDRWDPKRTMVVSDALRGVLSLSLIWAAVPERVWLIYPLAFVISSVGVFFVPARGSVMKSILKPDQLLPANILLQTTMTFTLIMGPALAGVTIGLLGVAAAFAIDALTFFVSSSLVATMRVDMSGRKSADGEADGAFWAELKEGLRFVAGSRTISGLLLVMTVISLATGAVNALFVPFMMNVLQVGTAALGLADSAQGLGMVVGGLLAGAIAARFRTNWIVAGGLILASACIIAIGLAPAYSFVLLVSVCLGIILTPLQATIPAITQKVVPLEKMGRVAGTMNTSQSVATLLSMGVAGLVADMVGLRLIFVGAGIIGIVGGLIAMSAIRDE